jgi:4-hydroxybenzoate polyprenyltransferase
MAALTFDLLGNIHDYYEYIALVGVATAALYSAHRVIGLHKLEHIKKSNRYAVIREYKIHIWLYCIGWLLIGIWLFWPMINLQLLVWLMPGGVIAVLYVLPLLGGGRRIRDLGWLKIILIGWSWAWLTAFVPAYYYKEIPLTLALIIGVERMLFIIAITIPFEIRDLKIDASVGLRTLPALFGVKRSLRLGYVLCFLIMMLAAVLAFHYLDLAYFVSTITLMLVTMLIIKKSPFIDDDYFFSGVTDGLMILAFIFYAILSPLL